MNSINQPSILRLLFGCKIDAGSVFRSESFIWLEGIYRRMAARRSIRRPYYSEIKRDIPKEIFLVLVQSIERHKSQIFNPPNCYVARNKKAIVVSFTSIISVKNFLSSLSSKDVTGYMERTLAGYRKGHRVNVLVTDTKDFALTYYIRKGQLIIWYPVVSPPSRFAPSRFAPKSNRLKSFRPQVITCQFVFVRIPQNLLNIR